MLTKNQIAKMLLEGYLQEKEALNTYLLVYGFIDDPELKEKLKHIIESKKKHPQLYMDLLVEVTGLDLLKRKSSMTIDEVLNVLKQRLKDELRLANSCEEILEMKDIGDLKLRRAMQSICNDSKNNAKRLKEISSELKKKAPDL